METIFCNEACKGCAWFKSYYVVWKPIKKNITVDFKAVFKSYYVVWKQQKTNKQRNNGKGLNRTM